MTGAAEWHLPKFTDFAPRCYNTFIHVPRMVPLPSPTILSSKQAYKVAGHIWGEVCGKGTRGAACAVHRPPRPSPPLEDKNPFREWNMWETGPPRGIILNYVCPHLSDRRFHLVALRPFVNRARDPGFAILLPFPRFVPDAFFGA